MNPKSCKRIVTLLICLVPICLLSGCGALRYFDGSSDEEVRKFSMSREDMEKQMATLQSSDKALRATIDQQQAMMDKLESKDKENIKAIRDGQARIVSLEKEKNALLEESKKLTAAVASKEEVLVEKQTREKAQASAVREIRIKVLSGDGKLSAARALATKLKGLGYNVERVDRAPTTHFRNNTVFFAKDLEREAKELAGRLGEGTAVKPMTWSSRFNIIVVAKEN